MATDRVTPSIPEIITEEFLAVLREHGAVKAYVFGSMTRGEERPDSDLDLLVTFDPPISLLDQFGLVNDLSEICGREVDLMTRVHPYFAPYIEPTLIALTLPSVKPYPTWF
jgi:predicted nucleotidyltransferase